MQIDTSEITLICPCCNATVQICQPNGVLPTDIYTELCQNSICLNSWFGFSLDYDKSPTYYTIKKIDTALHTRIAPLTLLTILQKGKLDKLIEHFEIQDKEANNE